MKAICLSIIVVVLALGGILLDAARQRKKQQAALTTKFITSVANYLKEWALTKRKLPGTLDETNAGAPWLDPCGNALQYEIIKPKEFEFSLASSCGGALQVVRFRISGTNLNVLRTDK
jgi:hypothetical protein